MTVKIHLMSWKEIAERVAENADFALYSTFYTYPRHTA